MRGVVRGSDGVRGWCRVVWEGEVEWWGGGMRCGEGGVVRRGVEEGKMRGGEEGWRGGVMVGEGE